SAFYGDSHENLPPSESPQHGSKIVPRLSQIPCLRKMRDRQHSACNLPLLPWPDLQDGSPGGRSRYWRELVTWALPAGDAAGNTDRGPTVGSAVRGAD